MRSVGEGEENLRCNVVRQVTNDGETIAASNTVVELSVVYLEDILVQDLQIFVALRKAKAEGIGLELARNSKTSYYNTIHLNYELDF